MLKLTLTVISAIIVGAAAFAGVERYTEATTASSVTAHDADVNADTKVNAIDLSQVAQRFNQQAVGARPVAEQNLDANGSIRVHDPGGRVIELGSHSVGNGQWTTIGSFVDVRDCASLSWLVEASIADASTSAIQIELGLSLDAEHVYAVVQNGNFTSGTSGTQSYSAQRINYWNAGGSPASPFVRPSVYVTGGAGSPTNMTLSLYCTPF